METLEDQISQGLADKRIEALIAQKIHTITSKFDSQLSSMLATRDYLARFKDATVRAKSLSLNANSFLPSFI